MKTEDLRLVVVRKFKLFFIATFVYFRKFKSFCIIKIFCLIVPIFKKLHLSYNISAYVEYSAFIPKQVIHKLIMRLCTVVLDPDENICMVPVQSAIWQTMSVTLDFFTKKLWLE